MKENKRDWTWATKSNEVESLVPDLEIGRTYTVQPIRAEKLPNGRHAVMVYVCELGEFRTFQTGCFGKYIFTLGEEFSKAKFHVVVSKAKINGKMTKSWKVELAQPSSSFTYRIVPWHTGSGALKLKRQNSLLSYVST